jgi:glutamate-1-semialdehyde 2,1-aminomutase
LSWGYKSPEKQEIGKDTIGKGLEELTENGGIDMKTAQDNKVIEEEALIEKYMSMSKASRKLYERACKVFPDGSTRRGLFFPPYPAYIVKAEGCRVYDADGRGYIDYTNNLGPLILGHRNPRVMKAITDQLESGTVLGGPTELEVELAEKIIESFPSGEQVIFCASGTEANMLGLRVVRAYTGKQKILKCEGAFHGTSIEFSEGPGISQDTLAKTITVPFNDIRRFEAAIRKYRDELAAVFMEPILRGIPPQPDYLEQIRKITEENGILLVFDEVVTGFRLSRGGAQEKWGVRPDMTLLGKVIGGGFSIGALVTRKEMLKPFKPTRTVGLTVDRAPISHAGTWNAHPVAMAAGLATLEELTHNAYAHLDEIGETLRQGMENAAKKAGIMVQVVGVGSVFHIYFTDQPIVDSASAKTGNQFLLRLYDLHLITRGIYPAKAHCSFISTPITHREVQETLEAVEETLHTIRPIIRKLVPSLTIK